MPLYFVSVLYFDKYSDKQLSKELDEDQFRDILFFVKEHAIIGLSTLFRDHSGFWKSFDSLKILLFQTNKVKDTEQHLSEETALEVAKNKSILTRAYIYALRYLFGAIENEGDIITGLDKFHIGFQLYDDYTDINEDKLNDQLNYFNRKIEQKQEALGNREFEYLHKLSYIDNTISEGLKLSLSLLNEARDIFLPIQQHKLLEIISETAYRIESELYFIERSIHKAKQKAGKSNLVLKNNSIQNATALALKFLKDGMNEQHFWEDFMTNAGYGKEWITGYILCMIGEVEKSVNFISQPLDALLQSKSGYNSNIVQDGDSSNFMIKALQIFGKEIEEVKINTWLSFSKDCGGWATYYDNGIKQNMKMSNDADFTGWFTPQLCVSTVAAWALKDLKGDFFARKYNKTVEFINKKQNNDGSWPAYWWTENIYPTVFAVLCLPKETKYKNQIESGISYILDKQSSDGCWKTNNRKSSFYTALATKALIEYYISYNDTTVVEKIKAAISWLIDSQMQDGSWRVDRILKIPYPEVSNPDNVAKWQHTSFGLNCLVDDHNRSFTTATVFNCLSLYAKYLA